LTTHRAVYFLERVGRAFGKNIGSLGAFPYDRHRMTASPTPPDTDSAATIHLGLVKGENYGWGVCSTCLIEELSKFRSVHVLKEQDGSAFNSDLQGKLVQALTTVEFPPLFEKARADQNYGYTFFEEELNEKSIQNAKKYDLVLAGSTWCRDRMLEKGILNCAVLIQGIDPKLFYPIENQKPRDRFVIFSGGKFELRKGQDLVLRAVKVLQDKYQDVYLMNCWYNLWPQSVSQMTNSPYIAFSYHENEPWIDTMQRTYRDNGLDPDRVITLEPVLHHKQRELFQQTDIGVFPNRCEGGTNLVLMEYMACAKPVIASNTSGHKDIITKDNALPLNHFKEIKIQNNEGALVARWQDPSLDELIARLEYAYHHRDELHKTGRRAGEDLRHLTWKRSAEHLATIIGCGP
jgi:glycosyltransferase involved in cell wall biosynthesis